MNKLLLESHSLCWIIFKVSVGTVQETRTVLIMKTCHVCAV